MPLSHDSTILKIRMPIYEYECAACGRTASHVVLGSEQLSHPDWPDCGSSQTRRVMSSFAVMESEAARLNKFDASKPRDESFTATRVMLASGPRNVRRKWESI